MMTKSFFFSKQLLGFCVGLLFCLPLAAQTAAPDSLAKDQAAVKDVVNALFAAMKNADTLSLKACFSPSPILQSVARDRQGKTMVRQDGLAAFSSSVGQLSPGRADERIQFASVLVDGDLASVWTPYRFYLDGKFSHCGANSFQLVRLDGQWKIQYLIDTRRRNGCAE
jgi:hypothetical protein